MSNKTRLDILLTERGLLDSRQKPRPQSCPELFLSMANVWIRPAPP